jgi:hypothetical protein
MNTNQGDDKEAINQFLHLGRLLFKIRAQHPSMSETDILRVSRLMTTVASGTLIQAVSQQGQRLIEKLSVEEEPAKPKGKPGRKAKLSKMSPEERQERVMKALVGSDGMLAGEIAQSIGLRGAQGLSPMLTKLAKAGLIRAKSGKKGEKVWIRLPSKSNGKSTNGVAHHHAAAYAPN